jgi:deoxyribodipyrimidine photo-lyase
VAGTGTDTRPNRVLNTLTQAKRFDPEGQYVRRYVPELVDVGGLEGGKIHEPWKLDPTDRRRVDYPAPIVDAAWGNQRFRAARAT